METLIEGLRLGADRHAPLRRLGRSALAHDDLAPATLRGYRYDLRHFLAWHRTVEEAPFPLQGLAEYELISYRKHMVAGGLRPATINRRLDALRRLCRWARGTGTLSADAAGNVRPMRTIRNRQPAGLTDIEVHALLRAAGASSHGLAIRNYALVQLMLQAGLRGGAKPLSCPFSRLRDAENPPGFFPGCFF